MAQKRRITPIMVSSEVSAAGHVPQLLQQAAPAPAKPKEGLRMSQKEQAEEATRVLGPGRHMYVELKDDCTEVSWPRLLKERGVRTKKTPKEDGQEAGLAAASEPGAGPIFKDPPKRGGGQSVLSNVIHKLEQQFVINGPDDSDMEAEGAADKGSEEASATDEDAVGNEDDQGGFNDLYDMDDEFIDDTELQDYFGSDRRKTKYGGFFINKGEIEKTDEEIVLPPDSPPKKKRRMKKPESGVATAEAEATKRKSKRPRADEAEDADRATQKERQSRVPQSGQLTMFGKDTAAAADRSGPGQASGMDASNAQGAAAVPVEAAHQPTTQAQVLFGSEVAAASLPDHLLRKVAREATGASVFVALPDAPEDGAQEHSELNKEVLASIEKLKRAAEKQPLPEPSTGAAKQMPVALKAPIKAFAMVVMRQAQKQKNTLKFALDAVMPVMEAHTTRAGLSARIKSEWQKTKVAADRALDDLKAEVNNSLLQGGGLSPTEDGDFVAAQASKLLRDWTWTEQRKKLLWEALTRVLQVKGGGIGPGRGAKIYAQVAEIFPAGTVSKDDLRNVYNEEKEARAARAKEGKQSNLPLHADHSQQGSELPASHPGTPYPSSSAAHSSQPRPGSASVRPASAASQELQAPIQQARSVAVSQPMVLHAHPARQPPQPLSAMAEAPAASQTAAAEAGAAGAAGPIQSQCQPSQPLASVPRPTSAGAAGLVGVPEQQTGLNGAASPPEKSQSQAADALQGGHSRLSEAEHAQRLEQAIEAAALQGADRKQLQTIVRSFKRGSTKAIVNEVLMHARPEGITIPEVIEKANSLGLTDPAWEVNTSRKSNLSSALNSDQTAFVHVGKSRYAHAAHKGVVHVPHARRRAVSSADAAQAAAPSQQDGAAAMTPQPSQAHLSSNTGEAVHSQAAPMQNDSAVPRTYYGASVGPPPARPLPSTFSSLHQTEPGPSEVAVQPPSASAAHNIATSAAPIRQ